MDNGKMPAMPESIAINPDSEVYYRNAGLTKREYFAGLAMQGILAAQQPNQCYLLSDTAKAAVEQTDALLKALEEM